MRSTSVPLPINLLIARMILSAAAALLRSTKADTSCSTPDILYLDPPYNSRQYASNYLLLELIAEGWFEQEPEIYGETGMRKYDHQKSDYASKNKALNALEDLILNSTKSKCILLSYNNEKKE